MMSKRFRFLKKMIIFWGSKGFFKWIPDDIYLSMYYEVCIGKKLDLNNPKSFNEKMQWLKINYRKPNLTALVDKYEVKKYISEMIGEKYVIPTIGVWNKFEDIDFSSFPAKFVLKCTHDSGSIVICKNKDQFNIDKARKKLNTCLNRNFYWTCREWPYKNVKPRIIAEIYMEEESEGELKDYKLMCFNGKFKCSFVCGERFSKEGLKITFYDENWNRMPFERHYPASDIEIPEPKNYKEMIRLSEILSKGFPFVRVDFYEIKGYIYIGELTFFPGSGFEEFKPEKYDYILGSWIKL